MDSEESARPSNSLSNSPLNSPWLAAIIVALLYYLVLLLQLAVHNQDISYFISSGGYYVVQPADLAPKLHILPESPGYDGQFFYQLATNPFTPQQINAGLNISNGPYRNQRIVYPLLVWLLSLGNRDLIPTMLLIVNYLALCALAWVGARYAQVHQRHALWGILFALYPGFLFTLTRDLAEILVALFLLIAVLSLQRSSSALYPALWLTLAVLTRETALIAVLALAISAVVQREFSRWPAVATPLLIFGAWQIFLWAKWGQFPVLAGGHNLGMPGEGLLLFLRSLRVGDLLHGVWIVELLELLVVGIAAALVFWTANDLVPYKLMWLGYLLLTLLLTSHVWIEDLAFMRAFTEFHLFGLVLCMAAKRLSLLTAIAPMTVSTWALVFFTRLDW